MNDSEPRWPIWIGALLIIGLLAWNFRDVIMPPEEPATAAVESSPVPEQMPVDSTPRYVVPEFEAPAERNLKPLPALDDSDGFFLVEAGQTFGPALESLLVRDDVIDRLVAAIDNLPRKQIPENIRPVGQLSMQFHPDFGNSAITLGRGSFERYNVYVNMIANSDLDAAYDTYRRFYPLFQQVYERLGYPNGYFNDRLVAVIDHLIEGPVPDGPVTIVRPNVLYEFADPDLEALSSGRKLLIRMGPDNAATMQRVMADFRERLVTE
ncbi:MAG: DUF3014 domain-containing protein [Pseudomonadota bacterium]